MSAQPPSLLKTFDNPNPERDYTIHIDSPEFTCLCPVTGQPDFADIQIEYIPDRLCVELKSLKFYFWSFREQGAYHEAVTNQMLNDLVELLDTELDGNTFTDRSPMISSLRRNLQSAMADRLVGLATCAITPVMAAHPPARPASR